MRSGRILLLAALIAAFGFRLFALDTYGFSTDESAKVRAIDAYRRGEFWANAEHPMLMKLTMWGSLSAGEAWNRHAPAGAAVAPETALRLPNVVAGTVTVAAMYAVAHALFGPAVALAAAGIVALDPNITSLNRLGKEDTFAMLFLLVAVALYERAKRIGVARPEAAYSWYTASGGSFGLMMASKYVPHFFGMYAVFNYAAVRNAGTNAPRKVPYYTAMAAAFLATNFAVVLPETFEYVMAYLRREDAVHHGYMYNGGLWANPAVPGLTGVPAAYYLHLLATKVPVVVLAAASVGLVLMVSRRRERGYIWLRVFLLFPLLGYSLFAGKFLRYALSTLLVVDLMAAVGLVWFMDWVRRQESIPARRVIAGVIVPVLAGVALLAAQMQAAPFYSAHQNVIGAASAPPVTTFPEEAYDFGVREAVHAIAEVARPGASIVSDAPGVVRYYLGRTGRHDLEVRSLSGQGLHPSGENWVLVQESHIYFENVSLVTHIRNHHEPWREYRIRGTPVLEVFRLGR